MGAQLTFVEPLELAQPPSPGLVFSQDALA